MAGKRLIVLGLVAAFGRRPIGCLGIALRSFGVLWTSQNDNGYLAEQMAKPRQPSMVIAP